jgi:hypothetical protein
MIFQDRTMVFPRKQPFTKRNLRAFFDACKKGTIDTDEFDLPDKLRNFDKSIKGAVKLTEDKVKSFVDDPENDRFLLIFDSSKDYDRGKKITFFFSKAAARYKELGCKNYKSYTLHYIEYITLEFTNLNYFKPI